MCTTSKFNNAEGATMEDQARSMFVALNSFIGRFLNSFNETSVRDALLAHGHYTPKEVIEGQRGICGIYDINRIQEILRIVDEPFGSAVSSSGKPVLSDSTMQLLREFYYSRTPIGKPNPTVEEVERYFRDLFDKGEISEHSASANFNYTIRDIMDSYMKLEAELARFKSIPGFTNPVENNQLLRQQLNDKDIEIANLKAELAKLNQDSANAALQTSQQVADLQAKLDEVSKNNNDALMYIESEKDKSKLDIIEGFLKGAFTIKN